MKLHFLILSGFACLICLLFPIKALGQTDNATDSALLDIITDNVKKRISEVAGQRSVLSAITNTALIGTLENLTNYTLTITTDSGTQLASTSAATKFLKVPGYTNLNLADLPIDGHVAAIGSPTASDVLAAATVVYQDKLPATPTNQSYFGLVVSYDTDNYTLSVKNPQDTEPRSFLVSRRADLYLLSEDGSKTEQARTKPISADAPVLIIYLGGGGTNGEDLALDLLIKPVL